MSDIAIGGVVALAAFAVIVLVDNFMLRRREMLARHARERRAFNASTIWSGPGNTQRSPSSGGDMPSVESTTDF